MARKWLKSTATNYHEAIRQIIGFLRTEGGWKMTAFGKQSSNGAGPPGTWTWDGTSNDNIPFNKFNEGGHVFDSTRTWWLLRMPGDPFPGLGPVGPMEYSFFKENNGATWGRHYWIRFSRGHDTNGSPVQTFYGAGGYANGLNGNSNTYLNPPPNIMQTHYLHGSGSGDGFSSPTFTAIFEQDQDLQLRIIGYLDDTPPYRFVTFAYALGGQSAGKCVHMFIFDPMIPGTYIDTGVSLTSDHDPYITMIGGSTGANGEGQNPILNYLSGSFNGSTTQGGHRVSYQRSPLTGLIVGHSFHCAFGPTPGPNPYTGKDDLLNIGFYRDRGQGIECGWKGIGSTVKVLSTIRNSGDSLTVNTTRDWVVVRSHGGTCLAMPWDFPNLGIPDV